MRNYRRALASADLRRLFAALVTSATGTWAYNVALLAWVYSRTHSLGWVGAAGVLRMLPSLILSVSAGVLAERTERIRLMVGCNLACMVSQLLLAGVVAAGLSPVFGILCAVLTSAFSTPNEPAVAATIPSLAGADELAAANALNSSIEQLVVIAGPAVGALLLALGSATVVFLINAASFAAAAVIVSRIRTRSRPVDVTEGGTAGVGRQLAAGFRAIAAQRAARLLVAYCVLVTFLYGSDTVLFIDASVRHLGTGADGWGYLLAGLGVGGLLAALVVDRFAEAPRLGLVILSGALGYCLPTALLVVIRSPALAFAVQVFRGSATLFVDVLAVTALQRSVPEDVLARVFGVFFALVFGAIALASLLTPVLVGVTGLDAALWTVALVPAALALAGYPALRAIDRAAAARAAALAPLVDLLDGLDIFAAASRSALERLAAAATVARYSPGDAIVQEGEASDALYILTDGHVDVRARGESGADRSIRTMDAPTYFGEVGLIEGIPRTATVIAAAPCECRRIDAEAFLGALSAGTPSRSLLAGVSARLAVTHPSRPATARAGDGREASASANA